MKNEDRLTQIDQICDEFESQLTAEQIPTVGDYLLRLPEEFRPDLLRELVILSSELLPPAAYQKHLIRYQEELPEYEEVFQNLDQTELRDKETDDSETVAPGSNPNQSRQIGPYKLLNTIGEGGMGSVYLAEQKHPVKRRVALKVIKAGMDSKEVIARFEAERQALAMMDHPCIARILDAGTTETGQPYFAMELVKGTPLNKYCDQHRLSISQRLDIFQQICEGIQHAHQKGIIHRDLKPTNILVTEYDNKAIPKIIDFGLAKALEVTNKLTDKTMFTEFGQVLGTLKYMSPEQAGLDSLDIDTRSDIYSLGVILYELLTGTTPLDDGSIGQQALLQVLELVREKEALKPSSQLSTHKATLTEVTRQRRIDPRKLSQILSGDLDWVVMKALEKDRNRRYESASDFANDIRQFLNNVPVNARPPSWSYKTSKFVRKHKTFVAAATLVATCLVAGIVGTSYGLLRALDEQTKAELSKQRALQLAGEKTQLADEKTRLATVATEAKEKAETSAKRTEAMLGLVSGAFESATPSAGADPSTLARDILIQAKESMDRSDLDDEGRRKFLQLLTNCFTDIGEYDKAVEMSKELVSLTGSQSNGDLENYLRMRLLQTEAMNENGQHEEVLPLIKESLASSRGHLGESHIVTLALLNNYGLALGELNQADLAVTTLEKCVRLAETNPAITTQELLMMKGTLSVAYNKTRNWPAAIKIGREVVEGQTKILGIDHPSTLTSMANLAVALEDSGDIAAASKLYEQSYQAELKKLGENHPNTLLALSNVALIKGDLGQLDESISMLGSTVEKMRDQLGDDHPTTVTTISNYASQLSSGGQFEKALELNEEVLEWKRKRFGDNTEPVLNAQINRANIFTAAGRLNDVVDVLDSALSISETLHGEGHPQTILILNNLAHAYGLSGQLAKAIPIVEKVLVLHEQRVRR